jgi:hypothetical protein
VSTCAQCLYGGPAILVVVREVGQPTGQQGRELPVLGDPYRVSRTVPFTPSAYVCTHVQTTLTILHMLGLPSEAWSASDRPHASSRNAPAWTPHGGEGRDRNRRRRGSSDRADALQPPDYAHYGLSLAPWAPSRRHAPPLESRSLRPYLRRACGAPGAKSTRTALACLHCWPITARMLSARRQRRAGTGNRGTSRFRSPKPAHLAANDLSDHVRHPA